MNISEFERTKPTETMKAINNLITKLSETVESDTSDIDVDRFILNLLDDVKDIKQKFKNGN